MRKLLAIICIYFTVFNSALFCAVSATVVWEIHSNATAANANGGGFNYASAGLATDLAATSTSGQTNPTVSSASYYFQTADITPTIGAGTAGAWLYIKVQTNWTQTSIASFTGCFWPIVSVTNSGASNAYVTLNAAANAAQCIDPTHGTPEPRWTTNSAAGISSTTNPTGGTWGTDYSQGDLPINTGSNLGGSASTVTAAVIGQNWAGNILHITAGTSWTQKWYEVLSVSGTTATVDSAVGGTSSGTYSLGGAISLGSSTTNQTDVNFFADLTVGNRVFVKGGTTYVSPAAVSIAAGTVGTRTVLEGYGSVRGDASASATRPIMQCNPGWTAGSYVGAYNLQYTSTAQDGFIGGTDFIGVNDTFINPSTVAGRYALYTNVVNVTLVNSDAISYRGIALSVGGGNGYQVANSYIHDSDTCVAQIPTAGTGPGTIEGNIIANCVTAGLKWTGASANTAYVSVNHNTFYGAENKLGTAVLIPQTGTLPPALSNNIFYGWATGVNEVDAINSQIDFYNDFYNNATNFTNWQPGIGALALNPTFASVSQIVNLGTVTSSTNVLTDTGASFIAAGVTPDVDVVNITAGTGTGLTAGIYPIHARTATTLTLGDRQGNAWNITSSGSGSAITYQITLGHNFRPTNMSLINAGFPGTFLAGFTVGYATPGAVQPQVNSGGSTIGYPIGQ